MFRKKMAKNKIDQTGQGLVEFALVLPVVIFIVLGIIEVGFLLFTYSSVNSAAREAARYGIAIGEVGSAQRYYDCDGIIDAGLSPGRFAGITAAEFTIEYDSGPDSTDNLYDDCPSRAAKGGVEDGISFGDRIIVTVDHVYRPLVTFMGLDVGTFTMSSSASRTSTFKKTSG